jgi:hypothetical protein
MLEVGPVKVTQLDNPCASCEVYLYLSPHSSTVITIFPVATTEISLSPLYSFQVITVFPPTVTLPGPSVAYPSFLRIVVVYVSPWSILRLVLVDSTQSESIIFA